MNTLNFNSRIHDYTVEFTEDGSSVFDELLKLEHKLFMIDSQVYHLFPELFKNIQDQDLFLFDALEEKKNLQSVEELYDCLTAKNAKRNMTLISIGGGITQDVSGFVASTLYRGINWIFFPTTFLAQADSCIGSKTSLNFKSFKNILGGFYPPKKIYIYPPFLDTLSKKDYFSGIGEVIKFALLKEEYPKNIQEIVDLIEDLREKKNRLSAIHKTMAVKKKYIDEDEFDTGKRNLFNYGHCFGHALENASQYNIPHGLAVIIGMVFSNIVSLDRQQISQGKYDELNTKLLLPNIAMELKRDYFDEEVLLTSMKNDKKRVGEHLTLVLLRDDECRAEKVTDFTFEEFHNAYLSLLDILKLS